jgi:hypothetical protein
MKRAGLLAIVSVVRSGDRYRESVLPQGAGRFGPPANLGFCRLDQMENWLGWQGSQPISDRTKSLIFLDCSRRLHSQLLHLIGTASKPSVLFGLSAVRHMSDPKLALPSK